MASVTEVAKLGWAAYRTWAKNFFLGSVDLGKSGLRFIAKNPKSSFVGGGIAVGSMTGDGALRTWANWVGGGDSKETAAEKVNRVINGDNVHGGNVVGDTLDSVAGEGTAKKVVDTVKEVKNGVVEVAQSTNDLAVRNTPSLPSIGQYADQQMAQYAVSSPTQYPQQGGVSTLSDFSPFSSFRSLLNTVTGGNTNMMSVAAMIPSALLMFGNFGWMGKIASLMLGSLAVKNLNHPYPAQNFQQSGQRQQQQYMQQYQQKYQEQLAQAGGVVSQGDDRVVMRVHG